jgi:hypothetical protein
VAVNLAADSLHRSVVPETVDGSRFGTGIQVHPRAAQRVIRFLEARPKAFGHSVDRSRHQTPFHD